MLWCATPGQAASKKTLVFSSAMLYNCKNWESVQWVENSAILCGFENQCVCNVVQLYCKGNTFWESVSVRDNSRNFSLGCAPEWLPPRLRTFVSRILNIWNWFSVFVAAKLEHSLSYFCHTVNAYLNMTQTVLLKDPICLNFMMQFWIRYSK